MNPNIRARLPLILGLVGTGIVLVVVLALSLARDNGPVEPNSFDEAPTSSVPGTGNDSTVPTAPSDTNTTTTEDDGTTTTLDSTTTTTEEGSTTTVAAGGSSSSTTTDGSLITGVTTDPKNPGIDPPPPGD